MFGGKLKAPMVIRGQQGVGRGNAGQHSQSVEQFFMHIPGFYVVMPSSPANAAGLLRTSIRNDNPVMFIEHKALYNTRGQVPDDPEFAIPLQKAEIVREGKDVTIIATHLYVERSLKVADKLESEGISCEVIDPRTLVPLDLDCLVNSVKKTGKVAIVHEAHKIGGHGSTIASMISEAAFNYLDAPITILGAKHCTLPFNLGLENAVVPQEQDIYETVKKLMYQ